MEIPIDNEIETASSLRMEPHTLHLHAIVSRIFRKISPTFVGVEELEHRLDLPFRTESSFVTAEFQPSACIIVPAALGHESVSDFDFLFARPTAVLENPLKDFFIRA